MIAENGSIFAYAYNQNPEPTIRAIRTEATTYAAAYIASSKKNESPAVSASSHPRSNTSGDASDSSFSVVYESPSAGTSTIITSIGDHILLAVTGMMHNVPDAESEEEQENTSSPDHSPSDRSTSTSPWQHVTKMEAVEKTSEELSAVIRGQLLGLRWPEDL
ncbi:MAG: hypothetical protein Q9227_002265 [Pyrenula ochraceoflavens]